MVVGGEKKPVGVVVEIEQAEQDLSLGGVVQDAGVGREKDERKKVRVCRDCLNVVLCVHLYYRSGASLTRELRRRQQEKDLPVRTPTWIKLYEVLVQLEKEIDESLPEFQELVMGIQYVFPLASQTALIHYLENPPSPLPPPILPLSTPKPFASASSPTSRRTIPSPSESVTSHSQTASPAARKTGCSAQSLSVPTGS